MQRLKAFLLGPEYITITGDVGGDVEAAPPGSTHVAPAATGIEGEAVVEVSLAPTNANGRGVKRTTDELQLPTPPVGMAAFKCSSALGTQVHTRSIADFDHDKQVYSKQELSPLPFQPPAFYTYMTAMLSGTFKVFQYVVTVMVALMFMQHAVERYWSMQPAASSWQALLFVLFISYPMITLMLVVLTNNEMSVRRFMYYRLMSMQVIVDWENTSFWRMWFFVYFSVSFVLLLIYSFWAGWLTSDDKTVSVWPQMSIVAMQSMLLFMFWLNIVNMEEQLVPLNRVIENSPSSAKEMIQHCEVVTEAQLKAALTNTYKRKKAFKRLSQADQDREGRQLLESGSSAAAFFDLNALRNTSSKRRNTKEPPSADASAGGCCIWWAKLGAFVDDILWRKLYAIVFANSFWSVSLLRFHRSGRDRAAATLWPYPGDAVYFRAMSLLSGICAFAVVGVEAYAIWFVCFVNDMAQRDKYGILECKMCYDYQAAAGQTCITKAQSAPCWAAAMRGYCSMLSAMTNGYSFNSTQVHSWDTSTCAPYLT